jgi:endo-1,4-beta-D-glucanase Y
VRSLAALVLTTSVAAGCAAEAASSPPHDTEAGAPNGAGGTTNPPPPRPDGATPHGGSGGARSDGAPSPGGAEFPFPQNRLSPGCTYPSVGRADDVRAAFAKWKTDLLTADGAGGFLRVRRPDSAGAIDTSNSEGMGYGMLIAVYLGEQSMFDSFWQYVRLHLNSNGLMDWEISPTGTVSGSGAATDGDEDMAFALVMADRQWGRGSLSESYLDSAKKLIDAIWTHEVDHGAGDVLLPGDSWSADAALNPSYFAPAYYRVFGAVTGKTAEWDRVVDSSYDVIEKSLNDANGNTTNGLVPAWCDASGAPKVPFANGPTHFQLDACRTPFRIGQDYCWFDAPRAKTYLAKISAFYAGIGAANIVDGYDLDGTPHPQNSMNGSQAASFVGPAAVGAMSGPDWKTLVDEGYSRVATLGLTAGTTYYQDSWTVLSLMMLTGNFSDFTAP